MRLRHPFRRREQTSVAGRLQRKANNIKNATPTEAARITVAIMKTERRAAKRQRDYDKCRRHNPCIALVVCFACVQVQQVRHSPDCLYCGELIANSQA